MGTVVRLNIGNNLALELFTFCCALDVFQLTQPATIVDDDSPNARPKRGFPSLSMASTILLPLDGFRHQMSENSVITSMAPIEGHNAKLARPGKLSEVLVDEGKRPEVNTAVEERLNNTGQYFVWKPKNKTVLRFHLVCFHDATEQRRK